MRFRINNACKYISENWFRKNYIYSIMDYYIFVYFNMFDQREQTIKKSTNQSDNSSLNIFSHYGLELAAISCDTEKFSKRVLWKGL